MSNSEFIAGLIGPTLIAIALAILTNRAALNAMIGQIADNFAIVFLAGVMLLVSGLAIVRFHNNWEPGWQLLVTAFGWLAILGGLVRMMIPDQSAALAQRFIDNRVAVNTAAILTLLFGVYLSGKGYGLF